MKILENIAYITSISSITRKRESYFSVILIRLMILGCLRVDRIFPSSRIFSASLSYLLMILTAKDSLSLEYR